jgi:hypothetical protein
MAPRWGLSSEQRQQQQNEPERNFTMIRSHTFESSAEAYDVSQCTDAIRDGDVLLVPSEGLAAILMGAWPVAVAADERGPGAFHTLTDAADFRNVAHGAYLRSASVAVALYAAHQARSAGLGDIGAQPVEKVARSLGWAGEIPEQERFPHEAD